METLLTLDPESCTKEEKESYPVREAARAVLLDERDQVALLYVSEQNYYKLPGGGVEADEGRMSALKRECLEETGCQISVISEIGIIVEYRKFCSLKQISYCYLAKINGEKDSPTFTSEEQEEGFELRWFPSAQALQLLSKNEAKDLEGRDYIVPRDSHFLKSAKLT